MFLDQFSEAGDGYFFPSILGSVWLVYTGIDFYTQRVACITDFHVTSTA